MLKNIKKIGAIVAITVVSPFQVVNAGVISYGNTSVTNPTNFEDFTNTSQASSEILSNQFADNGINFVSNSGYAPVLFNNNYCLPVSTTLSGSYATFGITTGCGISGGTSGSILFDNSVTELSFDWTSNNLGSYNFEALFNGQTVSSLSVSKALVGSETTFLYTGDTFNELRFTQATSAISWFWMENLSWNESSAKNTVSEPSILALMSLGIIGIHLSRRRMKK